MTFTKIAAAAALLAGLHGVASAQSFVAFSSPGFTTETTTVTGSYLTPASTFGTVSSYSVLSINPGFSSSATVSFAAPVTSFSFLWGSPDSYNMVSDGTVSVTGSSIGSGTGNNADTTLYTFTDLSGFSSLTFSTSGVAFELAQVSPVPEPGTFALVLAGLGVVGFAARRRSRD